MLTSRREDGRPTLWHPGIWSAFGLIVAIVMIAVILGYKQGSYFDGCRTVYFSDYGNSSWSELSCEL